MICSIYDSHLLISVKNVSDEEVAEDSVEDSEVQDIKFLSMSSF